MLTLNLAVDINLKMFSFYSLYMEVCLFKLLSDRQSVKKKKKCINIDIVWYFGTYLSFHLIE